jgi:hypothetical protein
VTLLLAPARQGRSLRQFVGGVVVVTVVVRLLFLVQPVRADEAGYLLVAQTWHRGGPNLYGRYWVDRPPGLIALFKLASLTGWPPSIRLIALPFVALFVFSVSWAAQQVAGSRAARWAAVLAAALMATPLLATQEADGELFAVPLVMVSVALTIGAVGRAGPEAYRFAAGAGLAAGLAVSAKQNFGDAAVFALVLVVASSLQRQISLARALALLGSAIAGGLVVVAAAVGFAVWSGVGEAAMWFDLYGFRGEAFDVIEDHSWQAPMDRAGVLVVLSVLSGLLPILLLLARQVWRRRLTGSAIAWAVALTVGAALVGIGAGGSYWPHYLIQLTPMVALAGGIWAAEVPWLPAAIRLAVASSVVSVAIAAVTGFGVADRNARLGTWLHDMSRSGDSLTVLYGHEAVQLDSGLPSPYPYLWTLPMRTLDPHLGLLRALVVGPRAPTWVVVWNGLDTWGLDRHDTTRLTLATHYRMVRRVCGHEVWLRDGGERRLLPSPSCRLR